MVVVCRSPYSYIPCTTFLINNYDLDLSMSSTIFELALTDSLRLNSSAARVSNHVVSSWVVVSVDMGSALALTPALELGLELGLDCGFELVFADMEVRGSEPNKVDRESS